MADIDEWLGDVSQPYGNYETTESITPRRTDRDPHLSKLIESYRHRRQLEVEAAGRRTRGIRKLRNGRKFRI